MKILVACETSGVVRRAFAARGHDVISCDLLPAEDDSPDHRQCDVRELLEDHWDMVIAHPPCTDLSSSGARWFPAKRADGRQQASIGFAMLFLRDLPQRCRRVAVENPIGILSTEFGKPDQIIQPWQFGHGETKATCLWLFGLPRLTPTDIVEGREARVHRMPPGTDRWKERSRTYEGIAAAMADQWGKLEDEE